MSKVDDDNVVNPAARFNSSRSRRKRILGDRETKAKRRRLKDGEEDSD